MVRGIFVALLAAGLAGCATSGEQLSDAKASPEPIATTQPSAERKASGLAQASPPDAARMRQAIAQAIESHIMFRTIYDGGAPRLRDAKFIGPFEMTEIFGRKQVAYCASATIDAPLIPYPRVASITFVRLQDGREEMRVAIPLRYGSCHGPKAVPFPELEQARELRRKALGKNA